MLKYKICFENYVIALKKLSRAYLRKYLLLIIFNHHLDFFIIFLAKCVKKRSSCVRECSGILLFSTKDTAECPTLSSGERPKNLINNGRLKAENQDA